MGPRTVPAALALAKAGAGDGVGRDRRRDGDVEAADVDRPSDVLLHYPEHHWVHRGLRDALRAVHQVANSRIESLGVERLVHARDGVRVDQLRQDRPALRLHLRQADAGQLRRAAHQHVEAAARGALRDSTAAPSADESDRRAVDLLTAQLTVQSLPCSPAGL